MKKSAERVSLIFMIEKIKDFIVTMRIVTPMELRIIMMTVASDGRVRMSKAQDKIYVDLYKSGINMSEIGRRTGVHCEVVRQRLIQLGVHKKWEEPEPEPLLFAEQKPLTKKYVDNNGKVWTDITDLITSRSDVW